MLLQVDHGAPLSTGANQRRCVSLRIMDVALRTLYYACQYPLGLNVGTNRKTDSFVYNEALCLLNWLHGCKLCYLSIYVTNIL
jgi:hypothetical protein